MSWFRTVGLRTGSCLFLTLVSRRNGVRGSVGKPVYVVLFFLAPRQLVLVEENFMAAVRWRKEGIV